MRRSRQRWDDVFSVLLRLVCVGAGWESRVQRSSPSWWALVDKAGDTKEKWELTVLLGSGSSRQDDSRRNTPCTAVRRRPGLLFPSTWTTERERTCNRLGAQHATTPSAQLGNETFDGVAAPNRGLTDRARERAGSHRFKEH